MNAFTDNTQVDAHGLVHRYVRIDGQRIHCVSAGSGRPVLLIPGWPQTWYAWREVIQALAARGFQAIAVDPPGTGQSDRPEHGYDTGAVADVLHRVMEQLGFERYSVVGHDVGMWVAYALASDRPEAVERLALTEAVIPGLAEAPPIFVEPGQNIFLWHFMFNQLHDLPEALIAGRERVYLNYIFDKWSHRRDAVATEYIRPMPPRADCVRASPTTGRFPRPCARTSSAPNGCWQCRCWPSAPSTLPTMLRC